MSGQGSEDEEAMPVAAVWMGILLVPGFFSIGVVSIAYLQYQLGIVWGAILFPSSVLITTVLGVGKISGKQASVIFFGTQLVAGGTFLLAEWVPDLEQFFVNPFSIEFVFFEILGISTTLWMGISCVMIAAFPRRLPVDVVPTIMVAAVCAALLGYVLMVNDIRYRSYDDVWQVRLKIAFLLLMIPQVTMGSVFRYYAAYIVGREVQS